MANYRIKNDGGWRWSVEYKKFNFLWIDFGYWYYSKEAALEAIAIHKKTGSAEREYEYIE